MPPNLVCHWKHLCCCHSVRGLCWHLHLSLIIWVKTSSHLLCYLFVWHAADSVHVAPYHSYFLMRVHLQLVYFCCHCGCCWDGTLPVCCVFTCGVCVTVLGLKKSTNLLVCPLGVALTRMFWLFFVSLLCRAAAAAQLNKENSSLVSRAWSSRTTVCIKVGLFGKFLYLHEACLSVSRHCKVCIWTITSN